MSPGRQHLADAHRIVVKLGTHVVMHDGDLARARIGDLLDSLTRLLVEDLQFFDPAAQIAEFDPARRMERIKLAEQIDELQRGKRVEILVENRVERGMGAVRG